MPAYLNSTRSLDHQRLRTTWPSGKAPADIREQPIPQLSIGLINNMPDGALEATERQFLSLLDAASGRMRIRLSLYSLPGISRNEAASSHVKASYSSFEDLWNMRLDGLIVTGREPLTSNLADEPYWEDFTRVFEWAQNNTYSTIWSCLAAHAAVLHGDGICRVKSESKHTGILECAQVSDHALMARMPSHFRLPHSRWNGVAEEELTTCGYRVLTRTAGAGVDAFIKQYKSLFIFFQGHPEYESDTLLFEYRRDVGRYLRGEIEAYPLMPQNYFDQETTIALTAMQREATLQPRAQLFAEVSRVLSDMKMENTWRSAASCIYKNWLEYLSARKQLQRASVGSVMEEHANEAAALVAIAATEAPHSPVYINDHKSLGTSSQIPRAAVTAR